jgi:hypothetical protein
VSEPVRAVRAEVKLGESIVIDGYMLPNGEFRYGPTRISLLLGYGKQWLSQVLIRGGKRLEALQGKGFTGSQIDAVVSREGISGASQVKTISFDDLCVLVEYEANQGNIKALALLSASFREVLRERTLQAFHFPTETTSQKQAAFEQAFMERERLLAENREEVTNLWLPGDGLYYPGSLVYGDDYSEEEG